MARMIGYLQSTSGLVYDLRPLNLRLCVDATIACRYNVITMKASIITIGNSKGIRIPKPLLEESGLSGEVELKAVNGEIKITPAPKTSKVQKPLNEEYVLSLSSLSDWNSPEEDKAWAYLQ
jgi:antitoxin component of MazEF toxin-antitoxin module